MEVMVNGDGCRCQILGYNDKDFNGGIIYNVGIDYQDTPIYKLSDPGDNSKFIYEMHNALSYTSIGDAMTLATDRLYASYYTTKVTSFKALCSRREDKCSVRFI